MKFPVSWLKEYVDISVDTQTLADRLSVSGFEVESIETVGKDLSHIITARIEKIEKHPNADRLSVTQVFDGKETRQIVCGAKNIYEGAIVPVSLPGAKLPGGLVIKESKIRDIESKGMICSETELGLESSGEGIWLLPSDTPLGVDFVEYAHLTDDIIDVSILPNRGDCLSMIGLAREISALYSAPLRIPNGTLTESESIPLPTITVETPELCPLYIGRVITNVENKATPMWMKRRLELAGIRSLGLIIDITNYVLLETGQPLHAFDRSKIAGDSLTIKRENNHLIIANNQKEVAIAGIAGNKEDSVSDTTTEIILESAYFDPTQIRKSSKSKALRTESSVRFERNVDPNGIVAASNRAAELLATLCNANIGKTASYKNDAASIFTEKTIPFTAEKINGLLGSTFSQEEIVETLHSLDIQTKGNVAHIPSWRKHDLEAYPCLAEEVIRIRGFDHIPELLPEQFIVQKESNTTDSDLTAFLIANGFYQLNTYPLTSESQPETLQLQNPINPELAVMRKSMLTSISEIIRFNQARQQNNLRVFEIANCFEAENNEAVPTPYLALAITDEDNFLVCKGLCEALLATLNLHFTMVPTQKETFHPKLTLSILLNGIEIGTCGMIHPQALENTFYMELNLSLLVPSQTPRYKAISKFPSTRRDLAILAPKSLTYGEILSTILSNKPESVQEVFLFDHFESEKMGADKKSIGIGMIYQHQDRTLSDDEVNASDQKLRSTLLDSLPIQFR